MSYKSKAVAPSVEGWRQSQIAARDFDIMKALHYFALLTLFACSADPIPSGHYVITTGQETDTLTMTPAPVTFALSSEDSNLTNTKVIETSDKPIDTIDVGNVGTNFFILEGKDSNDVRRVQATSYAISAMQLAGYDVPLFMGRTDAFCRPPGTLGNEGNHPPVGVFWGQLLWMAGSGTDNQMASEGYDLVGWKPAGAPSIIATMTCPKLPCRFQSIANYGGAYALGIGSDWAIAVDIQLETTTPVDPPKDMSSWSEVSGGRSIDAFTGASYVVGPTRSIAASTTVLELATDGNKYARLLSAPRQQAATTYVNTNTTQGLLVLGGSADGAGAEFLAASSSAFVALPYPADSVVGAALLAESTGSRVWRVGGKVSATDPTPAPTVVYDLACKASSDCPSPVALPAYDLVVTNAYGFSFGDTRFVIGEQDDGTMIAWRITDTAVTPIPIREPRRYSTVFSLPNGFAALIGGTLISTGKPATSLELLAY